MLSVEIRRLLQAGKLTVAQVSEVTGIADSTIYRWAAGEVDPSALNLRLLFRHCGSVESQSTLLGWFTRGTPWVTMHLPADLDVNGDGDVNADDARAATIKALRQLTEMLEAEDAASHALHVEHRQLTPDQDAAIDALSRRVIQLVHTGIQVRQQVASHRRKRRRCRQPVMVGGLFEEDSR